MKSVLWLCGSLFVSTTSAFGGWDPTFTSHLLTTTTTSPALVVPTMMNPITAYLDALSTWPLATKMITGGSLAVAGDALAQARVVAEQPYDARRAASFALFDMAYRALQHATYPTIVAHFHGQYLCGAVSFVLAQYYLPLDVAAALERTMCSQLGIVPFIYYPVFFTLTAALQGLNAEAAVQRAKDMFVPLMQRNLMFWVPAQFVQFSYVPEDLQIPFVSVCGLVWTAILSVLAGAAAAKDSLDEEPYCVIGNEDECLLPDDLFPHATLEDVAEELVHEWEFVAHELDEITHAVLGTEDDPVGSQEEEALAQKADAIEEETTTTTYRR